MGIDLIYLFLSGRKETVMKQTTTLLNKTTYNKKLVIFK